MWNKHLANQPRWLPLALLWLAVLVVACGAPTRAERNAAGESAPAGAEAGEAADGDKVTVCHLPGGDAEKGRSLAVGAEALADHLAHGDLEGACPDDDRPPIDDEVGDGPGAGKAVICHVPPGEPDNARTLEIGGRALAAHLRHGDAVGACGGDS